MVLAHGIGARADLPLPFWLFAYGAVAALAISFLTLRLFWNQPRLAAAARGRPVALWPPAVVVAAWVLGTFVFVVVVVAAFDGPQEPTSNLAPVAFYVVFWVGVQAMCAVAGDVWRGLAPWAPRWWRGRVDDAWAGAVGLLGFAWLELCYHEPASPRVVGVALVVWAVLALSVGDPFGAWFRLVAALAPVRRDDEGRLRLRPPCAGLATVVASPAVSAVVLVALGSTAFDGLTRTSWWRDVQQGRQGWDATLTSSLGLLFAIAVVALLFRSAMEVTALTGEDVDGLSAAYVPSLVPIAFGYVVAHYFSLFVFEGQAAIALASDPFGRGWDLFGTVDRRVDYLLVSTDTIAWVQAAAVLAGHVAGVVVAHDRAVERHGAGASRSQYPLLAVMIGYTVGGLALLLQT